MDIETVFRLSWQILCFLLLLDGLGEVYTKGEHAADIKIVDAAARSHFPSMPTSEPKLLSLRVKPANISGPPHLQQFAGLCFSTSEKGYTYEVCPFQNVTQKEDRVSWNSFHGVLGVWREWVIANDTFTGMKFAVGEKCGSKEREVEVLFNCSTLTRVYNITEPRTCSYTLWLDTPLACFKGAMQVYHVLSAGELEQWDQLELEYYSGEITFQGLTKRRKKLLIAAGLQYDPERKETLNEEKQTESEPLSPPITNPIVKCVTEKLHLEKELKELKDAIEQVVKDHPALASKFSFLKNASNGSVAVPPPGARNGSEEPSLMAMEEKKPMGEQQAADILKDEGEDIIDAVADQNTLAENDVHSEMPEQDQQREDLPLAGVEARADHHRVEEVARVEEDEKQAPGVRSEELKTDPVRRRLEKLQGLDKELHVSEVLKTPVHPPDSEVVQKEAEDKVQDDSKETADQKLQELLNDVKLQDILNEP